MVEWQQPILSANGTLGGTNALAVIVDTKRVLSGEYYYMLDSSASSVFRCDYVNSYGLSFTIYTSTPIILHSLTINSTRSSGGNNEYITKFQLSCCNDNKNYKVIEESEVPTNVSTGTFLFTNTTPYKYHKLTKVTSCSDYFYCSNMNINASYYEGLTTYPDNVSCKMIIKY